MACPVVLAYLEPSLPGQSIRTERAINPRGYLLNLKICSLLHYDDGIVVFLGQAAEVDVYLGCLVIADELKPDSDQDCC